jgi:hypothetical protein
VAEESKQPEVKKPRPEGEPAAVTELREKIETTLVETVGGYGVDERNNYLVGLESARAFVVPTWTGDDEVHTVARVFAITNLDVPVTAELTSWLLAKNLEFVFGAFALDVNAGAIWFNHNLMGKRLDPEEFAAALHAVVTTADRFDDEIKERFGGRLYIETPGEATPTPPTPGYL